MQTEILNLATAQIVAAYVAHNQVDETKLPDLIAAVSDTLAKTSMPIAAPAVGLQQEPPARPLPLGMTRDKLVQPDAVSCGLCGFTGRVLAAHIKAKHNMTPQRYREAVGLAADAPLTAPNYAQTRSDIAKRNGLGRANRTWSR